MLSDSVFINYVKYRDHRLLPRNSIFLPEKHYISIIYTGIINKYRIILISAPHRKISYYKPTDDDIVLSRRYGANIADIKSICARTNACIDAENYLTNYDDVAYIAMCELNSKYITIDDISKIIYSYLI